MSIKRMFSDEIEKAKTLNIKLSLGIGVFQGFSNFFINSMVLGVIYAGGYLMINNEINPGQLMAYLAATQLIQRSFAQFSLLFGTAIKGMSSGGRVFEVWCSIKVENTWFLSLNLKYLNLKPNIPVDDSGVKIENFNGQITFRNVGFTYPTRPNVVNLM